MRHSTPEWLHQVLGEFATHEGATFELRGQPFVMRDRIPRSRKLLDGPQAQTRNAFEYKWKKRDTFDSQTSLARARSWLVQRYGEVGNAPWLDEYGAHPLLLDAGCGAGMSALELFAESIHRFRYLGVDVSEAVDVGRDRFEERGVCGGFLQADITDLPLLPGSVDLIFSEGVLHHTDSTQRALAALAHLLKPGGRILFYVYRRKGPLREYSDDHIRAQLRRLTPAEAWEVMKPLTRLGISLGELGAEVDIAEPIDVLGIPAGRIDVQRLFYWHVAKAFYQPDLTFEEMNHINFDWYAPANAHRQSPEEVREWCNDLDLGIERQVVEDAGITVIARKHR
jgi:arsenite methyltransferase